MLQPDRYVKRLHEVPHDELEREGICGLIVDLDNTLMGFRETTLGKEHIDWVAEARLRGFKIIMVSNNFTGRVTRFANQLEIPCIPNALKPLPFGVMRAMRLLKLPRKNIAVVGDQLFTDVLAGKLCRVHTILTEPIETKDFPITMVFRFFERLILPKRDVR